MNLSETPIDSKEAYVGSFLRLCVDQVQLPDGSTTQREYLRHPGAVAILAQLDDGRLLLERQFRYPLQQAFFEIPAGKIDSGETAFAAAKRELLEETGYTAQRWYQLPLAHPCIGYSNEKIEYFFAEGLSFAQQNLDEGEFLEVFALDLKEIRALTLSGKITDSKTLVGLYWLNAFFDGELTREPI